MTACQGFRRLAAATAPPRVAGAKPSRADRKTAQQKKESGTAAAAISNVNKTQLVFGRPE
jgi:hypothetical protein